VRSGPGKPAKNKKKEKRKKKYSDQQRKEMDCDEPHPAPNEKMQGIQWTERPTGALVAAGSLWPQSVGYVADSRPENMKQSKGNECSEYKSGAGNFSSSLPICPIHIFSSVTQACFALTTSYNMPCVGTCDLT
jgi:hypothetical protein